MKFDSLRAVSFLGLLVLTLSVMLPSQAHAKGVLCFSVDQNLRVELTFGSTISKAVFKDPTVSQRHELIATFAAADGVLQQSGSVVLATVDLKNPGSSRGGERIGGTLLRSLKSIAFDTGLTDLASAQDGQEFSAEAQYLKNNGEELEQDFDCVVIEDETQISKTDVGAQQLSAIYKR